MKRMRTQVAIVGGGPAGLLLSHLLHLDGVESVVLERQTRAYVLGRVRAGVLEWGTVGILRDAGLGERMDREGMVHDGTAITWGGGKRLFLDIKAHTGRHFMAYGQTRIQEDLDSAVEGWGGTIVEEALDVLPHDVDGEAPWVTYNKDGEQYRIDCDFVAGCDGFHGVSRTVIPGDVLEEYERVYPFGWLGILSETPPLPELIYCNSPRGFALASMRNPMLSRYYLQVSLEDQIDEWPDDRFWEEIGHRYPDDIAAEIVTGSSVEKSIAPIRSYVAEPMRYGRLFLAGDSAHIVPPTGAKGLNLAASDVYYLSRALLQHYQHKDDSAIEHYSATALARVWKAERFSWTMTRLLHRYPDQSPFDLRMQQAELEYLESSVAAQAALAENYIGLPY